MVWKVKDTMPKHKFMNLLEENKILIGDGAMGTMLHNHGADFEQQVNKLTLTPFNHVARNLVNKNTPHWQSKSLNGQTRKG